MSKAKDVLSGAILAHQLLQDILQPGYETTDATDDVWSRIGNFRRVINRSRSTSGLKTITPHIDNALHKLVEVSGWVRVGNNEIAGERATEALIWFQAGAHE
jgi:hypothetical protein